MRRRPTIAALRARSTDLIDVARQLALFGAAYGLYEIVRGLVATSGTRPFTDATRIIDLERSLHVFDEERIEAWVTAHAHWLLDAADWIYLNAHFTLTAATLAYIYVRRRESFCFVRNMFAIAMGIALIGYVAYPAAPPRLMPQWGFTDAIEQFTGIHLERGVAGALFNPYAAVPSMHVCIALIIGGSMSRLVRRPWAAGLWLCYPVVIAFVVVVTGNHYFTDVVLGAFTAAASAVVAKRLLARARPEAWAFRAPPARPATASLNRAAA